MQKKTKQENTKKLKKLESFERRFREREAVITRLEKECKQAQKFEVEVKKGREKIEKMRIQRKQIKQELNLERKRRVEETESVLSGNWCSHISDAELDQVAKFLTDERTKRNELKLCVVCLDKVHEVLFQPCNHLKCCKGCAKELDRCPFCREVISNRVNIFS